MTLDAGWDLYRQGYGETRGRELSGEGGRGLDGGKRSADLVLHEVFGLPGVRRTAQADHALVDEWGILTT